MEEGLLARGMCPCVTEAWRQQCSVKINVPEMDLHVCLASSWGPREADVSRTGTRAVLESDKTKLTFFLLLKKKHFYQVLNLFQLILGLELTMDSFNKCKCTYHRSYGKCYGFAKARMYMHVSVLKEIKGFY